MSGEVVLTANIYENETLVVILQFSLSPTRKWGKVIAEEDVKKVIEDRLKAWEGELNNGQSIFDVLNDLQDGLGFGYSIVSIGVAE
jgi:hypothetical protein